MTEKRKLYNKNYYQNNRGKILEQKKKYYQENIQERKDYAKEWRTTHADERRIYKRNYANNKLKTDINFKLTYQLRDRLRKAIKSGQKSGSAVRDLGCTIPEFKLYLEAKFQLGMSWDNYGKFGWHIDHIIPLYSFNLSNREELLKAVHYTNLQPLWAEENWEKQRR